MQTNADPDQRIKGSPGRSDWVQHVVNALRIVASAALFFMAALTFTWRSAPGRTRPSSNGGASTAIASR